MWRGTHRETGGTWRSSLSLQSLKGATQVNPVLPPSSAPLTWSVVYLYRVSYRYSRLPLLALGKDMSAEGKNTQHNVAFHAFSPGHSPVGNAQHKAPVVAVDKEAL